MKITERRLVVQEWFKKETEWISHGWFFLDSDDPVGDDWKVTNHLKTDEHINPIYGVVEREINAKCNYENTHILKKKVSQ